MMMCIQESIYIIDQTNHEEETINMQIVEIKINNNQLLIINVHINSALKIKGMKRLQQILSELTAKNKRIIVAGDLNMNIQNQ